MISFRDMTFCNYYFDCKGGGDCFRAFSPSVQRQSKVWWSSRMMGSSSPDIGEPPVSLFSRKPDCFVEKDKQ